MVVFLERVKITLDHEGGEGGGNKGKGQEARTWRMSESLRQIGLRKKQAIWIRRRAPF